MHLIVFDCDGTLVDSQNAIFATMAQAFAAQGLRAPTRASVLSIVGLSLPVAIATLLPDQPLAVIQAVTNGYKQAFQEMRAQPASQHHHEPLFPGIRHALQDLRARDRVTLGIATGKSRRGVDGLIAREGWHGVFATIQTADDAPSKPDPAMIHQAMVESGSAPERTMMIGDTSFDMAMARAAGVRALGVSWGYHALEALREAGAHDIVGDVPGMLAAIDEWMRDGGQGHE